jgi:hypothetical protein
MINLPYGNCSFNSEDLRKHIMESGRGFIIQGQTACTLAKYPKPNSLDYWLRNKCQKNIKNTKQAVNEVVQALIKTRDFEEGNFICPDSGRKCKGLKLL